MVMSIMSPPSPSGTETLTKLGKYTLELNTMLNDNNSKMFSGRTLPNKKLNFTITGQAPLS